MCQDAHIGRIIRLRWPRGIINVRRPGNVTPFGSHLGRNQGIREPAVPRPRVASAENNKKH